MGRVYNFSAGPSMLPLKVLEIAAAEMTDYRGSGQSVMEMSHRSPEYQAIIESFCGREGSIKAAEDFSAAATAAHQTIADAGCTWVSVTAEAKAAFQAAADAVSATWPSTITVEGFDAAAYMADAIAIATSYSK